MSWCDEDGNYSHKTRTNAEAGVMCDCCSENIADCEGQKLYEYNGSWHCKSCLIENILEDLNQINADDMYDE